MNDERAGEGREYDVKRKRASQVRSVGDEDEMGRVFEEGRECARRGQNRARGEGGSLERYEGHEERRICESVESRDEGDEGRVQSTECEGLLFESEVSPVSIDHERLRHARE